MKKTDKNLLKVHRENMERLETALKDLKVEIAPEPVHEMRIAVKKIKSFMHFLDHATNQEFRNALPGKLKTLFAVSGLWRDMQNILDGMPIEHFFEESLEKKLNKKESNQMKRLNILITGFKSKAISKLDKQIRKTIEKFSAAEIHQELFSYLHFLEEKVVMYSNVSNIDSEELHYLRKVFKRMIDQHELINKIFHDQENSSLLLHLENTEKLIGKWHDVKTARSCIIKITWKENQNNAEVLSYLKEKEMHLHGQIQPALGKIYSLLNKEKELILV